MGIAVIAGFLVCLRAADAIHLNFTYGNSTVLSHAVALPKCCKPGSVMTDRGCSADKTHQFKPRVAVLQHNSTHLNDEPVNGVLFEAYVQNVHCAMGSYPLIPESDNFCLLENGSLVLIDQRRLLSPSDFCFETVNVDDEQEEWLTTAFVCAPLPTADHSHIYLAIYATGLAISCVSLAAVCVIYGYVLRKSAVFGKYVVCFAVALLSNFLMVALAQILNPSLQTCNLLGILFHVFLIAALGFVAMISAETYCSVREFRGRRSSIGDHRCYLQLFLMVLSAVLMVTTTFLMYVDGVGVPTTFLKPELGQNICWYNGTKTGALYFAAPVVIQIALDLTMVILTHASIHNFNHRYSRNAEWEFLKDTHFACVATIILISVCWGVETATLILETGMRLSVALDVLESLQGLVVFLIFAKLVKSDIWQRLTYRSWTSMSRSDGSRNESIFEPAERA